MNNNTELNTPFLQLSGIRKTFRIARTGLEVLKGVIHNS